MIPVATRVNTLHIQHQVKQQVFDTLMPISFNRKQFRKDVDYICKHEEYGADGKRHKITKTTIAKRIGFRREYLHRWINGTRKVPSNPIVYIVIHQWAEEIRQQKQNGGSRMRAYQLSS